MPFGDEITSTTNDREKFATYTRDSYTGLDYADQRFYASTYGRFNTPDRSWDSAGADNPGSWNRYNYASGDPVNRNDPTGLDDCDDPGDLSCTSIYNDQFDGIGLPPPDAPCMGQGGSCSCIGAVVLDPECVATYGMTLAVSWLANDGQAATAPAPPICTVSLDYRPVGGSGPLSLVNHSYIDVITSSGAQDVIEGLPQSPSPPWGNLTSNLFPVLANGSVVGDSSDHPFTDRSTGGVGGPSVCQQVTGLLAEEASFPTTKYNPVPGLLLPGSNSNTYASTLLAGVGLNLGTPPSSPGFGLGLNTPRVPLFPGTPPFRPRP
jgi:RHS repeat-associated protein